MIKVIHAKRSTAKLPAEQVVYVDRTIGKSILANPFTHLKTETRAQFQVDTLEEAVEEYRKWFYIQAMGHIPFRKELWKIIQQYQRDGVLYLACWCKDELDPRPKDHACHCDVIREWIHYVYPALNYYAQGRILIQ